MLQLDLGQFDAGVRGDDVSARATARSSSSAMRQCPKPGARTTTDCMVLCMLPPTSNCRAGPSTSSARTTSGRSARLAASMVGMISCTAVTFLLVSRISGFSRTASIRSASVTMYAEI